MPTDRGSLLWHVVRATARDQHLNKMAVKKAAAPAERVQRESKNKNTGAKANNTIPMEVPKEDVGQRDLKDRKHAIGHGLNEAHAAGVDLKTLKKKGTEASRRGARRAKASRGN